MRSEGTLGRGAVVAAALGLCMLLPTAAAGQEPVDPAASPTETGPIEPSPTHVDPAEVSNDAIVELEARIEELEADLERLAAAESEVESAAVEARDALAAADQRLVEATVAAVEAADALALANARLASVERALRDATDELAAAEERLAATELRLAETRHRLQVRVRDSYKGGPRLDAFALVLDIEEFNQAVHLRELARTVVAEDQQLLEDYLRLHELRRERLDQAERERDRVTQARERTAQVRREHAEALDDAAEAEAAGREEQRRRDDTLAEVEADLANLGAERLELEAKLDELRAELEAERRAEAERRTAEAAHIAEARRRALEQADDGATPDTSRAGYGCGSASPWTWPTVGCVTSPFGFRQHPVLNTSRLHAGFDIPGPAGQAIHAVAAGTVYRADFSTGGHGNVVVIDHGEVATLYAHQSTLLVAAGQHVEAGQQIGTIGSTGLSTGPHLHFEVHLDRPYGTAVDPMPFFE